MRTNGKHKFRNFEVWLHICVCGIRVSYQLCILLLLFMSKWEVAGLNTEKKGREEKENKRKANGKHELSKL